ncbi:MAG: glycosyltransferase family 39 protein [Candidatus Paceibacterota bacterium]
MNKAKYTLWDLDWITILFFTLISIAISIQLMYLNSIRLDEAQSIWQVSHSLSEILDIVGRDVHVPLYHIILHFWQGIFNNSVISARYLSLFISIISIPLVYILFTKIYTKKIGLMTTILFILSPFINWYANEARMYSLLLFLALLNSIFFIDILKKDNTKSWVGFILTAILGIYTHYFYWLFLISNALFYLVSYKHFSKHLLPKFIISSIILLISIAPWIYYVISLGSAANTKPELQSPTSIDFSNIFSQYIFGFQTDIINKIILSSWPIIVIIIFTSLQRKFKYPIFNTFVIFQILIPIGLAFMLSYLRPIFLSRYLIVSSLFLYAYIVYLINTYFTKQAKIVYLGVIFLIGMFLLIQIFSPYTPVKENFEDISIYLIAKATVRDVIVLSAPFTIYPFEYYYQGITSVETFPRWDRSKVSSIPPFDSNSIEEQVNEIKEGHQYMYVILSYDQGYEKEFKTYLDNNFQKIDKREFSPGLVLYQYKLTL